VAAWNLDEEPYPGPAWEIELEYQTEVVKQTCHNGIEFCIGSTNIKPPLGAIIEVEKVRFTKRKTLHLNLHYVCEVRVLSSDTSRKDITTVSAMVLEWPEDHEHFW
jgi:hypothetical protein